MEKQMKKIMTTMAILTAIVLVACGGNRGEAPSVQERGDCDYKPGDSCITEENLARCKGMAAKGPGEVLAMESCPLQFACPQ